MAETQPAANTAESPPSGEAARSDLFVRNATGLVRGVPSKSSIIINFIPGHPTQTLAAVFFFALTLAPGGNVYLGIVLVFPMMLAFAYAFGLLTEHDSAFGRRLHACQPRASPGRGSDVLVLYDDGRPAVERVLRTGVRDRRTWARV